MPTIKDYITNLNSSGSAIWCWVVNARTQPLYSSRGPQPSGDPASATLLGRFVPAEIIPEPLPYGG